jgi:hypothetical protein
MDFGDLLYNSIQDGRINDVHHQVAELRREHDARGWDGPALSAENLELKLRLGLLVRLLIDKGLITAEEYAALIAEARPQGER